MTAAEDDPAAAALPPGLPETLPCMLAYWGDDLRCRYASRDGLDGLGLTAGQVIGRTVAEVLGPDYERAVRALIDAAVAGGPQLVERQLTGVDGSTLHHQVHAVPDWTEHGEVRGVHVMILDVTRLKDAQRRLGLARERIAQATLEAQAAGRAQSRFLAHMSHEIRTPLHAIVGLTHLLDRGLRDTPHRDRVERIGSAASQLLRLVDDLLDLSRIEAGPVALAQVDFEPAALLRSAIDAVSGRARERGLSLALSAPGVPGRLRGDPARLGQMLDQLLDNAVKFTETGGVRLQVEVLDEGPQGLLLKFVVLDTGIGIDPARQAALFEPFEQGDASATRRHGGAGLGLSLTRRFARLMGGEAGLQSAPGSGSAVWFTARLQRAEGPERPAQPDAAVALERQLRERHHGQRVLVAEDNPVNQGVAVALLEGTGLVVDVADDGVQAVERATGGGHDLVLMDVQMPAMDGLDAARELRRRLGPRLPIIAMTANAYDDERQACLAAGMNDHLAKPVSAEALYAALLRWLPRPAPVEPEAPRAAGGAGAEADGLARVGRVAGLDVEAGLASAAGRPALYLRMLRRYAEMYAGGQPVLGRAGTHDERQAAMRACHATRGACAMIGAAGLAARLRQHEDDLAAADADAASLAATGREIDQALQALAVAVADALRPADA